MKKIIQQYLSGERALFHASDLEISYTTFADGESPLKESSNIHLINSNFKWKYPLWYSKDIVIDNCVLFDTARSGIWYTKNLLMKDTILWAPKTFRRSSYITLKNVDMPNALESFWNCEHIRLEEVTAKGDYFGFNSSNIYVDGLNLCGNYCFDGGKNIEVHNSKLISKDAFWNCENVVVYDSVIMGEYLSWNSKNITFINCTIESLQGLCYMQNVTLKNCRLINTTLAFEYSNVDAEINGTVDSVFNPSSGVIKAEAIKEITLDPKRIDPSLTTIEVKLNV